jgi:hypothetical protein|tara:strand:+ start:2199 stop:2510 length:312 start_codon:yes stop_codon:yes gene_type:complete
MANKDKKDNNEINDYVDHELKLLGSYIAESLINLSRNITIDEYEVSDADDHLVGELARCMTLKNLYLDREEYEKCAIMKLRITTINNYLGIDEGELDNTGEDY